MWAKYKDDYTIGVFISKKDKRFMIQKVLDPVRLEIHPQSYSKIACR